MPYTISPQTSENELSGIDGLLDAIQRREDSKWRGHVVHEAQTTFDFALKVLLHGFVIGFGGLMASRGRMWIGSSMTGLGTYMTYEEMRQFLGENKLATAAIYLAGGEMSQLKNYVVLEREQLHINPSEITQAVMKLVDSKNKVVGLAFKYFDTAFSIDEKEKSDEGIGLAIKSGSSKRCQV